MSWENLEQAFKDLDAREFTFFAAALASYRRSLMKEGFTRREALRLVETYSKFIYDMSIEEFIVEKRKEEEALLDKQLDDELDDDDDDVV